MRLRPWTDLRRREYNWDNCGWTANAVLCTLHPVLCTLHPVFCTLHPVHRCACNSDCASSLFVCSNCMHITHAHLRKSICKLVDVYTRIHSHIRFLIGSHVYVSIRMLPMISSRIQRHIGDALTLTHSHRFAETRAHASTHCP